MVLLRLASFAPCVAETLGSHVQELASHVRVPFLLGIVGPLVARASAWVCVTALHSDGSAMSASISHSPDVDISSCGTSSHVEAKGFFASARLAAAFALVRRRYRFACRLSSLTSCSFGSARPGEPRGHVRDRGWGSHCCPSLGTRPSRRH